MVRGLKKAGEEAHLAFPAHAPLTPVGDPFLSERATTCPFVTAAMAGLPVNQLLANAMKDSAEEASRNSSFHLARTYRKVLSSSPVRDCSRSA